MFRLLCPACGQSDLIEESRFLSDADPTHYIVCRACGWTAAKAEGVPKAVKAGQAVHQRDLDALLAARRVADAELNRQREATERQQRIAEAGRIVHAWSTGPVGNRVVNRGQGSRVSEPTLPDGVTLDDLDEAVRTLYAAAAAEAQQEATRRDVEEAERLAQRPAIERQMWAEPARREQEERRRRREAMTDLELSHPSI